MRRSRRWLEFAGLHAFQVAIAEPWDARWPVHCVHCIVVFEEIKENTYAFNLPRTFSNCQTVFPDIVRKPDVSCYVLYDLAWFRERFFASHGNICILVCFFVVDSDGFGRNMYSLIIYVISYVVWSCSLCFHFRRQYFYTVDRWCCLCRHFLLVLLQARAPFSQASFDSAGTMPSALCGCASEEQNVHFT